MIRIVPLLLFLSAAAVPVVASAQTSTSTPQRTREASAIDGVTLDERALDDGRSAPPATGTKGASLISRNEAYNRVRAAAGRVGIRLGNDASFRVGEQ